MILDIPVGCFGGPLRTGDIMAVANVAEYLRIKNPGVKFHMLPGSINAADYCQKFFKFFSENTDYFSPESGGQQLSWRNVNIFDFRDITGDLVGFNNTKEMKKKIVVFPLMDAPYNHWRNWPKDIAQGILQHFSNPEYADYEKIVCSVQDFGLDLMDFTLSTDFMTNIHHIMDAEIFVGGDTGTSHFAGILNNGPRELLYYYSSRALIHSLPLHFYNGRGTLKRYYLNVDGSTF